MNIALVGYGKEGRSAEKYFAAKFPQAKFQIFQDFNAETLQNANLSSYDIIVRSPSVPPRWLETADLKTTDWTSCTREFFAQCQKLDVKIIGVTGTKGKGTTSSLITALLESLGYKVWLVGNIGAPALDILSQIKPSDIVIYELSSFQLWDLAVSPEIAVITPVKPDHLNVHQDFADYLDAKTNITRYQTEKDYCVYNQANADSSKIASFTPGTKLAYPNNLSEPQDQKLQELLSRLNIPGKHNLENAHAALLAVTAALGTNLSSLLQNHFDKIAETLQKFKGLPHRLEFLRELNHVKYYDDNFSTNLASTRVALAAFPEQNIITIVGGRDKTDGKDLPELADLLTKHAAKVVLIGESGRELTKLLPKNFYAIAGSLSGAVTKARTIAESQTPSIVLMSPAAASFDMFENVYDRGAQFQNLVRELK